MEKLKNLCEIKKIIALVLTIVFAILSLKGVVSAEQFIVVFATIVGYYYGQSSARQAIAEQKDNK